MRKPGIGEQLQEWLKRVVPPSVGLRRAQTSRPANQPGEAALSCAVPREMPSGEGSATKRGPDTPAAGVSEFYASLQALPEAVKPDGRALALCREKVEGSGEDCVLALTDGKRAFLGAFDGCGGSGAKVYDAFGGHTGAWAASRAAALAARGWFMSESERAPLKDCLDAALQRCKASEATRQQLLGSLSREFPTTVAAFEIGEGDEIRFFWCGDSRCYALDEDGLHQITADDAAVQDAMRNLREDAPMTNVACASRPFALHEARVTLTKPALVFAATDGCFGYLPSPMAFERLLLEAIGKSASLQALKRRLEAQIEGVSGDDFTLAAWLHGFSSYWAMKQKLAQRLRALNAAFPASVMSEDALFAQWERYRPGYEQMLVRVEMKDWGRLDP